MSTFQTFFAGDTVKHNTYGKGTVLKTDPDGLVVRFYEDLEGGETGLEIIVKDGSLKKLNILAGRIKAASPVEDWDKEEDLLQSIRNVSDTIKRKKAEDKDKKEDHVESDVDDTEHLFHKNNSGPEEELFTLGDFKEAGLGDSIIRDKMIRANIKHLGLVGKEAAEYREKILDVLYPSVHSAVDEEGECVICGETTFQKLGDNFVCPYSGCENAYERETTPYRHDSNERIEDNLDMEEDPIEGAFPQTKEEILPPIVLRDVIATLYESIFRSLSAPEEQIEFMKRALRDRTFSDRMIQQEWRSIQKGNVKKVVDMLKQMQQPGMAEQHPERLAELQDLHQQVAEGVLRTLEAGEEIDPSTYEAVEKIVTDFADDFVAEMQGEKRLKGPEEMKRLEGSMGPHYYIDQIEKNVLKLEPSSAVDELWVDYNKAMENPNDVALVQKLRVIHNRLMDMIDGQSSESAITAFDQSDEMEIDEEEEINPDEEDVFFEDNGNLGTKTSVSAGGKFLGEFQSMEEAEEAVLEWMEENQFYPNCWYISDHGNIRPHTLSLPEKEEVEEVEVEVEPSGGLLSKVEASKDFKVGDKVEDAKRGTGTVTFVGDEQVIIAWDSPGQMEIGADQIPMDQLSGIKEVSEDPILNTIEAAAPKDYKVGDRVECPKRGSGTVTYVSSQQISVDWDGDPRGPEPIPAAKLGCVKNVSVSALAQVIAKQWSGGVKTKWHPKEGFFNQSAEKIAQGLKSESKDLKQAMSRLTFFINRSGSNLSADDKKRLENAKDKLHNLYGAKSSVTADAEIEAAKDMELEGTNLLFKGIAMDPNGNKVVKLSFPNGATFTIQTNGNLPGVHKLSKESDVGTAELATIKKEVVDYLKAHGSDLQKTTLKVYSEVTEEDEEDDFKKLDALQQQIQRLLAEDKMDEVKKLMKEKDELFNKLYEIKTFSNTVQAAISVEDRKALLEKLAEVEHLQWQTWAESVKDEVSPERAARWENYFVPYSQLDRPAQKLDLEWAEKIMEVLEPYLEASGKELVTKVEVDSTKAEAVLAAKKRKGKKAGKAKRSKSSKKIKAKAKSKLKPMLHGRRVKAAPKHDIKFPMMQKVDYLHAELEDYPITSQIIEAAESDLSPLVRQYLETALWSSTEGDDVGTPLDRNYSIDDFDAEAIQKAEQDVDAFIQKAGHLLEGIDLEQAMHDFFLSREGHGSGFFDSDYTTQDIANQLQELAKSFGPADLHVGDDGKLHF